MQKWAPIISIIQTKIKHLCRTCSGIFLTRSMDAEKAF
jgi:hypothetical protein